MARFVFTIAVNAAIAFLTLLLFNNDEVEAVVRDTYVKTELNAFNGQLPADKKEEKYTAMATDLFAFFRGTNHLFWKDLGQSSNLNAYGGVSSTRTWLSGDAHVLNIGAFQNDQGDVVFDLNDFDESLIADYQLDVWRVATSINLMLRVNGGFSSSDRSAVVDSFTESYLDNIETFSAGSSELNYAITKSNAYGQLDEFLSDVESSNSRVKMLNEYTVLSAGVRVFMSTTQNSDLGSVTSTERTNVINSIAAYGSSLSGGISFSTSRFTVKSVAERLHAGIGSLGTKRFYVLIEGPSSSQNDDVILDFKAQTTPSAFLNTASAAITQTNTASGSNQAKRVVAAYKALGYRVDDYLGWTTISGQVYSVRERSPFKKSFDTTDLTSVTSATNMAEQWGAILAAAHSRADKDANAVNIPGNFDSSVYNKINGYHSQFRSLVRSVIEPYALQVLDDFNSFQYLRSINALSANTDDLPVDSQTGPSPGPLSPGQIAGIVTGSVSGSLLLVLLSVGAFRARKARGTKMTASSRVSKFSSKSATKNDTTTAVAEFDLDVSLSSNNPQFNHERSKE